MAKLDDAIFIDGLVISKFSRALFEDMARGGITAANCTCSVWHGFNDTMANIAQWNEWFREHGDLITKIYTADDIRAAKEAGKVGIILGWQNTSALGTDIRNLQIFHELGVRVVQMTYNTQNLAGSGCWESRDSGLSDFGRHAIEEMNRLGILIDLSHVGPLTSQQTIEHSSKPVAYTHCCPMLKEHARNKTDDQLRAVAERGGFVGFASYTPFLPKGPDTTIDDCVEAMNYLINLVGETAVGIGTDWVQDQDVAFYDYLCRDKGVGRPTTPPYTQVPPMPKGLETLGVFGNFIPAMERAGWSETRIRGVLGENWLRFLEEAW
ncbi:MAG: membrane dipeptidase [Chromatiales bacterium]|jgi:membrane dipeptidase|nr:membrane dipeptidase [Chromatiales bacterium]